MKSVRIILAFLLLAAVSLIGYPAHAQVQKAEDSDVAIALADPQVAQQDTSRPPAENTPVDQDVVVIERKNPVYPEVAKKAGIQGKVVVKMWVNSQGLPRDVKILNSSDEIFNKPVLEAAWGWRFKAAQIKGKPVDVWIVVPFKFALAEKMDDAERKAYDMLGEIVREILSGKALDADKIRGAVGPDAYAVLGGQYIQLSEAIRRQVNGDRIIEPADRKIEFTTYALDTSRDASIMTVRSEGQGKNAKPRFHTIVFFRGDKGDWMIRGWHASQ
jgi:TonB family protein